MEELKEPLLEKQLTGHRNWITALHYSPNGQQIATSSLDKSVLLWDLSGQMKSYRFQGHDEAVMDVTFSSTGKYMASASRDRTVRLWVPTVTGSTGVFRAHSQTVRSVEFSPDSSKILTASDDKIIKLWSSRTHKFLSSFIGHTNWVRCARISNDGSVIASCSDDKTIKLWNPGDAECINTYKDTKCHGVCLAWHPSGCYVAIGTSNGNVKMFDIRTHNLVQYYSIHNDSVTKLAFHPSGSYIITASKDGKMKILDLLEGHPIFTLSGHSGAVNAVSFSPAGDTFASAGNDKKMFVWRTNFTELQMQTDVNENVSQNACSAPRSTSSKMGSSKGRNIWNLCYHSTKYPDVSFVHLDGVSEPTTNGTIREASRDEDSVGSSTLGSEDSPACTSTPRIAPKPQAIPHIVLPNTEPAISQCSEFSKQKKVECSPDSVGHINHIPRAPPTPATYTVPSVNDISGKKSTAAKHPDDGLFGMITLKENDVCYTSGTIEWVGNKRNYPINSGFKLLKESSCRKRMRKLDESVNIELDKADKVRDCNCADVLPTVNAIIDHLNALHEAVDLVDLRLNNLEGTVADK